MMVSVIVPVYNSQEHLCECIDSILQQTYNDIELVIVDDGSNDASPGICDSYAEHDCRVRVFHTDNHGPSIARNTGVEYANGEYVMFIDSDDMIHRNTISTLIGAMEDRKADAAIFDFAYGSFTNTNSLGRITTYNPLDVIELTLYQTKYNSSLSGKLLPRKALKAAPETPGILYEDLDAFYRILEQIDGIIVAVDAPMYYYRDTPGSRMHVFDERRLVVCDVTNRIEQHYSDNPRLLKAARDRKFSANYNMFLLCTRFGMAEQADRCWQVIREYRWSSLTNAKSRLKNRVGAFLSYLGPRVISIFDRITARL